MIIIPAFKMELKMLNFVLQCVVQCAFWRSHLRCKGEELGVVQETRGPLFSRSLEILSKRAVALYV